MTDEKLESAELIESKLLNIIAEIAPQKGLVVNQPDYMTFEERVALIEDFATHSELSLAYNELISLLKEGNLTLSATNSLALVWIGIVLRCEANYDGSISLFKTIKEYKMSYEELLESKLLNIIAEIAPQKGLVVNQPGYMTFEERVAEIEEFATHSEPSLAYIDVIGLLEEGNFTLSATNSLALVWIGIVIMCEANCDGSIFVDI